MRDDFELAIATAPLRTSKVWKQGVTTWGEMRDWVNHPARVKECGNYLLGVLSSSRRTNQTLVSRSALTLDADYTPVGLPEAVELLLPYACIIHSTFKSRPNNPRYRLVFPLDREATPEEYFKLCHVMLDKLGRDQFDPSTVEPARYMFLPSAESPEYFESWVFDGEPLPVDLILQDFQQDLSSLPVPKLHPNKRDPFTLDGAVGAFNRAYDFDMAIDAFELPYKKIGDRWRLVGASSEAGMGVVSEGLVYTHHVKDPAWGSACSAFDLVRLHRFGDLDDDIDEKTPINRRPSHQAMLDFVAADARVVSEIVGVDFAADMASQDWRLKLKFNPRTGNFVDSIENWDIVADHDPAFASLRYNEMSLAVETTGDFPWRSLEKGGPTVTATDRAALCHYLEREYRIRPARSFVDELINVKAQQRYLHPVREYLNSLVWDGTPRVEECLPGVTPTPYTRMVARKCLVAAAARILNPGCKWDHTLILFGPEGLGKSWWVEKLARGYCASLGRISDKDTLLVMQRSWIMLADEGYSLRKADADAQKEFLTRTSDVFRMPYDREAQLHPRHCVIWGTTNDEVFLRRQEGNRRFLIVPAEGKVDFSIMTDEYIDQLWAEAMHLYREGETLFLADDESKAAAVERERFTEEDALVGLLEAYLDTPVPDTWDDLSIDDRRQWMADHAGGFVAPGTRLQTVTCTAQLWTEALGRRPGEHRRTDLLEINNALKRLSGWEPSGTKRVPNYGSQFTYSREDLLG